MPSDTLSPEHARGRRELADAMPHIVWTSDAAGKVTWFNRKWTEYTGLDLAETLRVGAGTLVHPDDLPALASMFPDAISRGQPISATYRLRRKSDGSWRWHDARVVPMEASSDHGDACVGTAIDVDDQRRLSLQQRFLVEAGNVLGTSLDVGATLADVAKLAVPHLADWCSIDLLNDAGTLDRLAVAHVDPAKVQLAWDLWRRMPPKPEDATGTYNVIRTGRAEIFPEIPDSLLVQLIPDPEVLELIRSLGLRSSMSLPLATRDRVLGTLALVSAESGRRYNKDDIAFGEELGRMIASALDNARLYTEAKDARAAAEAIAAEILEQSRAVSAALLEMREERDEALERLARLGAERSPPGAP